MAKVEGIRGEMCWWGCVFWNDNKCGNAAVRAEAMKMMPGSGKGLEECVGELVIARMEAGLCEEASSMEYFDVGIKGKNSGLRFVNGKWETIVQIAPKISEKSRQALINVPGRKNKIALAPSLLKKWKEK